MVWGGMGSEKKSMEAQRHQTSDEFDLDKWQQQESFSSFQKSSRKLINVIDCIISPPSRAAQAGRVIND